MTGTDPALEATLRAWERSGDPVKVLHAANRRSIAAGTAPAPTPGPAPGEGAAALRQAVGCLYRECVAGCRLTRCWAGYGDRDGGARTTLAHCLACVKMAVK